MIRSKNIIARDGAKIVRAFLSTHSALDRLRTGNMPIDKPQYLKMIRSKKENLEKDKLYDILSYSRSFQYGLSPQSVKTLSLPTVERLLSTAYMLEYTEVSVMLAREVIRRKDVSKKQYHFVHCILVLAPNHRNELYQFVDENTVAQYISEIGVGCDIDTQVLSTIFSIWIHSNNCGAIASALEQLLEREHHFVPLHPDTMDEVMSVLCNNGYTEQLLRFVTAMKDRLLCSLTSDPNDLVAFDSFVFFIEALSAHPALESMLCGLLDIYWTRLAPERSPKYTSKDVEKILGALSQHSDRPSVVALGIGLYHKVMKAAAAGQLDIQCGVPSQAVSLLASTWGPAKYQKKKELLNSIVADFNRLCQSQTRTSLQFGQNNENFEKLHTGLLRAHHIEQTDEAYSEALVGMIDVAKSIRTGKCPPQRRLGLHIQSLLISVLLGKYDALSNTQLMEGSPESHLHEVMFELLDFVQKELVGVLPVDAVLMKLLDHIVEEARQHASALTDSDLEKLLQEKYVRIGATHGFDKTKGQRYSDHIKYVLKTVQAQYLHDRVLSRYEILLNVLVSENIIESYDEVLSSDKLSSQRRSTLSEFSTAVAWRTCFVMEMMANNLIDFARPGSEDFIARAIRVASFYHVVPYTLINNVIGHFYILKKYVLISDMVKILLLSWKYIDYSRGPEIVDSLCRVGRPDIAFNIQLKMMRNSTRIPPADVLRNLCIYLGKTNSLDNSNLAEKCFALLRRYHGADVPFSKEAWGDISLVCARSRWLLKINKPGIELLRLHIEDCLTYMHGDPEGQYDVFCDMMTAIPIEHFETGTLLLDYVYDMGRQPHLAHINKFIDGAMDAGRLLLASNLIAQLQCETKKLDSLANKNNMLSREKEGMSKSRK